MKAIVLTNAKINDNEAKELIETNIFKIALNYHAENLKPDLRISTDYGIANGLLNCFKQKVVIIRDYFEDKRIIYRPDIQFKGSTIIAGIEYLISENFREILLIADNTVHDDWFKDRIKKELDLIIKKNDVKIYQYSKGNFNLKTKTVEEFLEESEV